MENDPAKDIVGVVWLLTQGTKKGQQAAIDTYFSPDAGFLHPFVRVPRFSVILPLVGVVNSRMIVAAIYKWYRFMSPKITFSVHSSTYDERRKTIYLDLTQHFAIWFVPFYHAEVRLVTVLSLRPCYRDALGEIVDLPEDADVDTAPAAPASRPGQPRALLRIAHQNDLYQVNEWLRFLVPGLAPFLWSLYQVFVGLGCVAGSLITSPF